MYVPCLFNMRSFMRFSHVFFLFLTTTTNIIKKYAYSRNRKVDLNDNDDVTSCNNVRLFHRCGIRICVVAWNDRQCWNFKVWIFFLLFAFINRLRCFIAAVVVSITYLWKFKFFLFLFFLFVFVFHWKSYNSVLSIRAHLLGWPINKLPNWGKNEFFGPKLTFNYK